MDEQRCSAPKILKNLNTPSTERKNLINDASDKLPKSSAIFNAPQHWQVRELFVKYLAYSFSNKSIFCSEAMTKNRKISDLLISTDQRSDKMSMLFLVFS